MQAFGSWFRIPIVAIVLQAVLFAASHGYNYIGLIEVGLTGLCFGFLTWYSKSLEVSTALHTVTNLFSFLLIGFGIETLSNDIDPLSALVGGIMVVGATIAIVILDKKFNWFGFNEEENG